MDESFRSPAERVGLWEVKHKRLSQGEVGDDGTRERQAIGRAGIQGGHKPC